MRPIRKIKKILKYVYYRSVRVHGRPRKVAMGMAIGLGVGMTPTMGFQMVISVPLAALFGQNKFAAALGCWISNPITAVPLYSATYILGALLLGRPLVPHGGFVETFTSVQGIFSDIMLPCWVGGLVLIVPVALFGYWLTYQGIVAYRVRKNIRCKQRLHDWKWNEETGWSRTKRATSLAGHENE